MGSKLRMENPDTEQMGRAKLWLQAARPFSFTASMVPVLVGAAVAIAFENPVNPVNWLLLPLVIIASLLMHAATNMVSDYYDYVNNVDKDYTFGSSGILVQNLLPPAKVLLAGLALFALVALIGIVFIVARGWPILLLGVIGLLGGVFYCAKPIAYKYLALGDLMVFILMGPLMVIGSYYVLTGTYAHIVLLISLPVGCLVAAILSANNLRDIKHDTQAHVKTIANVLGPAGARLEYYALIAAAYLLVAALVFAKLLSPLTLIVLLSIPLAVKNFKSAHLSDSNNPETIATLDIQTAQLHLAFGVLLITALLIGKFIR